MMERNMEDAAFWRDTAAVVAIFAGIIFGALSVSSSAWVWVAKRAFGLGGTTLSVAGVVLLGMSIFKTVEFRAGPVTFKGEFAAVTQNEEQIPLPQPPRAVGPAPSLTDAEKDAMRIRQEAVSLGAIDPARPGRMFSQITFSVEIKKDAPDPNKLLGKIERVVYVLDPTWFSPSEIATVNRDDNFAYSLRAWGPTPITARIFTFGNEEPTVIRSSRIDTRRTFTF
jgi:hypothetical protein